MLGAKLRHHLTDRVNKRVRDTVLLDASMIADVMRYHLHLYLDWTARQSGLSRVAVEHYRNGVHFIVALRHRLAHRSLGEPELPECRAGCLAMLEVLRAHEADCGPAEHAVQTLKVLACASPADVLQLGEAEVRLAVLECALRHASGALEHAIRAKWPVGDVKPAAQMELTGDGPHPTPIKSICNVLVKHGQSFKPTPKKPVGVRCSAQGGRVHLTLGAHGWTAYMKAFKQPESKAAVEDIEKARADRDHGNLDSFDAGRVAELLTSLQILLVKLELDPGPLQQLGQGLVAAGSSAVVLPEPPRLDRSLSRRSALGSMRLGFRNPRGERGCLPVDECFSPHRASASRAPS